MKIAVAQVNPVNGNIDKNIALHQEIISLAIAKKVNAIFFPELSLTGYEPELAAALKMEIKDERLAIFQQISDSENLLIGIGVPLKYKKRAQIAMLIFQSNQPVQKYAKQILHHDELPYFVCGDTQIIFQCGNLKIAPAICYESLQTQHLENVLNKGANVYLASVAKSKAGIDKANRYFSKMAKEKSIPILMSNAVGFCDNFISAGQSAIWDKKGNLLNQMSEQALGILIYDTINNGVTEFSAIKGVKKEINFLFY